MPITKTCPHCEQAFNVPPSKANRFNFCSLNCKNAHTPRRICKKCGKEFAIKKSKIANGRGSYCSKACWQDRSEKHDIECEICKKHFIVSHSHKDTKYCSSKCRILGSLLPDPYHTCLGCGKRFINRKHTQKGFRYCSRICFIRSKRRTSIEVAIANVLEQLDIKFIEQYQMSVFTCDFFLPIYNLVIETDGSFWHSTPAHKERDERKNTCVLSNGHKLLRLSEEKITTDIEWCKQEIIRSCVGFNKSHPFQLALQFD